MAKIFGMQSFFDRYPRFRETSVVGTGKNRGERLDWRWQAIVNSNRGLFAKARVLDLASHDGRWSMAALDAGADSVIGIEGRPELVSKARDTLGNYGFHGEFIVGDVLAELPDLPAGHFDLILNLGFLYHTPKHYEVFEQMARLKPRAIILDTVITPARNALARFTLEGTSWDGAAIGPGKTAMVAIPSHDFIAMLCKHFSYTLGQVDWESLGVEDWTGIEDYRAGRRRTYVLVCANTAQSGL